MKESNIVFLNGEFLPKDKAKISVLIGVLSLETAFMRSCL